MRERGLITVSLTCAGLLLAYTFGGEYARVCVHWGVSQLCHGVSSGKILYAIVFVGMFCMRAAMVRTLATSREWTLKLWIAVAFGLIVGTATNALYLWQLDLPTDVISYHWKDGVNSLNAISHTHTSKACIAILLDVLGVTSANARFDTGAAYSASVPSVLSVGIGLSFLAALALSLWYGPRCVAAYHSGQRAIVGLVLALALSSVCKCILDGGILAYDLIVGVAFVWVLAGRSTILEAASFAWRAKIVLACGLAGWLIILWGLSEGSLVHQVTHACYRTALYAAALLIGASRGSAIVVDRLRNRCIRAGLAAGCISGIAWFGSESFLDTIVPLMERQPAGEVVCILSTRGSPIGEHVRLHGHATTLAAYHALRDSGTRAKSVSLAPRTGRATGMYADIIVLARSGNLDTCPRIAKNNVVTIRRIQRAEGVDAPRSGSRGARWQTQIEFGAEFGPVVWASTSLAQSQVYENERHVAACALDAALRDAGITEYVVIPYGVYISDDDRLASSRLTHQPTAASGTSQRHGD